MSTCYYLLLKRLEREGKIQASNYYDSAVTLYPKSLQMSKESIYDESVKNGNKHRSKTSGAQHRLLAESLDI